LDAGTETVDAGRGVGNTNLMVIGLDGATLELARSWAEQGRLPNLAGFLDRGAAGPLRSTLPVESPAAWSTFATGLNPGKHGVLSFYQWPPQSYEPQLMNAARRQGESFWEIAGRRGVGGGVINVPFTFPPRPYNGFIISGMLAPTVSRRMVAPPEILTDLIAASPRYAVDVDIKNAVGQAPERFLRQALVNLQARLDAAIGLYRRHRPPLFCVVFVVADRVSHYFWPYMEAARAGRAAGEAQEQLGDAIALVYERLDAAVGALVAEAGDGTDVVILSDHGSGQLRSELDLRSLLAREGLLVRQRARLAERLRRRAVSAFAGRAPAGVKKWVKLRLPALSQTAAGSLALEGIDIRRSKAYPAGSTQGVFVNLKGRQPCGIVEPGADYESVREQIIAALSRLRDPETGRPVARNLYRREEAWSGPRLDELPDVVMEQEEGACAVRTFPQRTGEGVFHPLPEADWSSLQPLGGHRREGLLLAKGPHVKSVQVRGANMADVPATILALLGCPIPEDFDGRVLSEMLTDDVEVQGGAATDSPEQPPEDGLTGEDRAAIQERLKGLGYL